MRCCIWIGQCKVGLKSLVSSFDVGDFSRDHGKRPSIKMAPAPAELAVDTGEQAHGHGHETLVLPVAIELVPVRWQHSHVKAESSTAKSTAPTLQLCNPQGCETCTASLLDGGSSVLRAHAVTAAESLIGRGHCWKCGQAR